MEESKILFPSPIGRLGITFMGETITQLIIQPPRKGIKQYTPLEKVESSEFMDEVFGQLSEYFAGARHKITLKYKLDRTQLSHFEHRVFREVAKIPYGKNRTYQRIASAAGHPDGYRQVLAVVMNNPIPILIPCHRIVTNKSGIGSYIAGKDKKKWLIKMEKESYRERLAQQEDA